MSTTTRYDVAVLGAGAAGLFCAARAGARGLRVVLIESGERAGRKILISGGGRCNFTNIHATPANFLSGNPHFAKSALARYTPRDFIALVDKHGIAYHEKTLGQLFCDGSAQAIVSMLEAECRAVNVEMRLRTPVEGVERNGEGFTVSTPAGKVEAVSVVVATGGLSIPKMGATGVGYDIARSFGLSIVEPRAALVPFTFTPEDTERWCDLAGLSAEVSVMAEPALKARKGPPAFREKMLVTHRGLSGPAVLQVSSYWKQGEAVRFDLAPGAQVFTSLLEPAARKDEVALMGLLREYLPARLAERWLVENAPPDWKNASLMKLEERLHAWTVTPAGTEGHAKAEVTAGGVDTAGLDSTTMQAKAVPGLAFIGEVVDVTGWLGGFNFQWAWASAAAAAAAL
jgi:predicted Rossmann fold flavoprotein